jgi:hypothetical protein
MADADRELFRGIRPAVLLSLVTAVALLGGLLGPPPASPAPNPFFGVASWDSLPPSAAKFQRLSRGGVGTARISVFWPEIEYAQGVYNWSRYDAIVGQAAASGVRVLPCLFGTPSFLAARPENPPLATAKARSAWRRFVKAAVARYGPNGDFWQANGSIPYHPVRAWEVWNEESSPKFWYHRVNAAAYVRLLRIAHTAAREIDSKATIVVGGLFPWPRTEGAVPLSEYLPKLYNVPKVKRYFEGVAIHPYTPNWKWTRRVMAGSRAVMDRNQDRRTGMWITEFGWSSGGNDSPYTRNPQGQAYQLGKVYRMLLRNRADWKLRAVCWFVWGDRHRQSGEPDWWGLHTGLFDADGAAKPAWSTYAHLAGGQP